MTPRVLLTGFRAPVFMEANPTEWLMAAVAESPALFPGVTIRTRVLDVDYAASQEQLERAIEEVEPEVVLAFGVDCDHDWISVERLAINLDCDDTPDNGGDRRYGVRIVEDGPVGYWATAPVEAICEALMAAGILATPSGYAGGHLCNHVLYYGLHLAATRGLTYAMGFLHVPPFPEQLQSGWGAKKGMHRERLLEATRISIGIAANQSGSEK